MTFKHISKTISRKYKDKKTCNKYLDFWAKRVILIFFFFWIMIRFTPICWIPDLYNEQQITRLPPRYLQAISLWPGQVRKWPTICGRSNFSPLLVCCFLKMMFYYRLLLIRGNPYPDTFIWRKETVSYLKESTK